MRTFPEPSELIVDKKGKIHLTPLQWSWFADYLHAKNHRLKYQKAAIKAFISGCLDLYLRSLDKKEKKKK